MRPRAILHEVGGPYREPKPLNELIAPDRRREKAIALVGGGMVGGVLLLELARWMLADAPPEPLPPPPLTVEPPTTEITPSSPPLPGPLTEREIESVVAAHRKGLKESCWDRGTTTGSSVQVTLNLVVGANGDVVSAQAEGTDALVASCVETSSRRWLFPAHGERSAPIRIPIQFRRE